MSIHPNTDLQTVYEMMRTEFDSLGIQLTNVDVEQSQQHYGMAVSSYYPSQAHIMTISFTCSQEELNYLRPFVGSAEFRDIPMPPPVSLVRDVQTMWDPVYAREFEYQRVCDCKLQLQVTGGSMEPFITSFRKETEKLRYVMESKRFDDEVDRMLTEDEYNS